MQITEVSVVGVRSSILVFQRSGTPLRFVLAPTVHIGRPAYYHQIADRLTRCQLIVAEGADRPSSTGLAYAIALRLSRQGRGGRLVHQNIDYQAFAVPIVWPDGIRPTDRRRGLGWWGWLDVIVLVPFLVIIMAVGGRGWLLRQKFEISDDTVSRLRWMWLHKLLLERRDEDLIAELTKIHEDRCGEDIDVGVVYGAAHFPAVVQTLTGGLGYQARARGEWLTAIDF